MIRFPVPSLVSSLALVVLLGAVSTTRAQTSAAPPDPPRQEVPAAPAAPPVVTPPPVAAPAPVTAPTLASPPSADVSDTKEKEAFEAAKELGTVAAWTSFLSHFPTGFRADLARAYVKQIDEAAAARASAPPPPPPAAAPPPVATPAPAPVAPPPPAPSTAAAPPERVVTVAGSKRGGSCTLERSIRSQRSDTPVKIRFVSRATTSRAIHWIDFEGKSKDFAMLGTGERAEFDTFLTHAWVVSTGPGDCIEVVVAEAGLTVVDMTDGGAGGAAPGVSSPVPVQRLAPPPTAQRRPPQRTPSRAEQEATCRDIGMVLRNGRCVGRTQADRDQVERNAARNCRELGMVLRGGTCVPTEPVDRSRAERNKNRACPAGMYRNPLGRCQPNETGS